MANWSGLAPTLQARARAEQAKAIEEMRDDKSISSSDSDSGSQIIPSTEEESEIIITELPNDPPQYEKCGCRYHCASFLCGCRKAGQECNKKCKCRCSADCQNPFSRLFEVFGDVDNTLRANACFTSYLTQEAKEAKERANAAVIEAKTRARNAKNAKKLAKNAEERARAREMANKAKDLEEEIQKSELTFVSVEDLEDKLLGWRDINNYPSHPAFDLDNTKYLPDWKNAFLRGYISPEERQKHFQALCRYGLSEDGDPLDGNDVDADDEESEESVVYFYSFCRNGWRQNDLTWHCRECGKCRKRGVWHCGECKKCRGAGETVCHRCGGVSKSYNETGGGAEESGNDERNDEN